MDRDKENELIMIAARWEAVCEALEGKEPSDFMLSFPEVRKVWDLYWIAKAYNSGGNPHDQNAVDTDEQLKDAPDVEAQPTFCPECGWNVAIDDDGCCLLCGATATGPAVDKIDGLLRAVRALVAAKQVLEGTE